MRLRRLKIDRLPGIEPGFTFEPVGGHVNIVTGPNAIGKSSLSRALKYLLGGVDRRQDPPNLHLEAEFLSGGVRWKVRRTGAQVVWMRDGEPAARPSLPGAGQFGLYRLSMESLLAEDASDRELADTLWRTLRGGFDLDAARLSIGVKFAKTEERKLLHKQRALREVEREYSDLRGEEERLPDLARGIAQAGQAKARLDGLQIALQLHIAIREGRTRADALNGFPAHMEKLHGDELDRLIELERKAAELGEKRKDARRNLAAMVQELESTGLGDAGPEPEEVERIARSLQRTDGKSIERKHAKDDLVKAEASLSDALVALKGCGEPPKLDVDSLQRAREIIEPLVDSQFRQGELRQRLEMAGAPPDESEIGQLRDGVSGLRVWLAAQGSDEPEDGDSDPMRSRRIVWAALALAGVTVLAGFLAAAPWAVAGGLATAAALIASLYFGRRGESRSGGAMDEARRRFAETGLESPPEWKARAVREHLRRTLESRLDRLRLQKERAEGGERLRAKLKKVESKIDRLNEEKNALARKIGIDPLLSGAPFYRFIEVTRKWDEARVDHAEKKALLQALDARIAKNAARIRRFLDAWRDADAPPLKVSARPADLDDLRIAFETFQARLSKANDAEGSIESRENEIKSLNERLKEVDVDIVSLFDRASLESGARDELAHRIDRKEAWRQTRNAFEEAEREEERLRKLLACESGLVEAAERGAIDSLEAELRIAERKFGERDELIREQEGIKTRVREAGRRHRLEEAARELDQAAGALKDKRDEAMLHAATGVLLDDVENAFRTEREPGLLRRARERFEQATHHAFTLELREKQGFSARDLKHDERRAPAELSSGTRMQLFLALRLAWTEDRERGGEKLPLFLDDALTTSDEDRFSVMAKTLSLLAESEQRQIFYLTARRHEAALWEQATGSAPSVIDLAAVRFRTAPPAPQGPRVEPPPPLPPPNGLDADTYATRIRVPRVDPRGNASGFHIFHILRDDLPRLHKLLETWRIGSVGQLESLLASDAAPSAISDGQARQRLQQRCEIARTWTELWRQGRGRPVDRAALEQCGAECGAVTDTFLDRAAALSEELRGDGEALVQCIRDGRLKGFYTRNINKLDEWLVDRGFIDGAAILEPEERRRLTLQRVVPGTQADAADVNRVVEWMEFSSGWSR